MFSSRSTLALMCALQVASVSAQYQLLREYSGSTFFNNWTYYGTYDNLTHGSVIWVDEKTATSNKLAYVDPVTNNAVLRVDNFTRVANGSLRNSVRINTNELYGVGSVWVGDFVRVPFGCSVWGSFWSTATEAEISPAVWPTGGEIDTFEAYNLVSKNTFTLHTNPGCSIPQNATNPNPLINSTDCDSSTGGLGCTVTANDTRSYGPSFSQAGGGVYVTEFGVNAISMWFFSRDDVPKTLSDNATSINTNSLGPPSAIYPATSCNIGQLFKPQSLVLDITLCGDLAGAPGLFNQTCSGVCYDDWVIGEPSNFDNAYFEIRAVRVFTMPNTTIVTPTLPRASPSSTGGIPPIPTFALASSAEFDIRRVALWSVLLTALTIVATVVTTGL